MTQYDHRYQSYQPTRRALSGQKAIPRPRTWRRMATLVCVIVLGVFGAVSFVGHALQTSVTAINPSKLSSVVNVVPKQQPTVAPAITSLLAGVGSAEVGIALEDISTGQVQTFGQNVPFEAASTAKLITAANYYHLVETNRASLDTSMGGYNAQFQIKEMINDSDNDAWSLLTSAIGLSELSAYAGANGINYNVANNALAPSDMATFLTKLYSGKLLNQTDTNQLLSYMQNTNDETLIPAAVPSNITVYHKYGLLNGELHDVAILTKNDTSYALVIYTKNTDDSDDQQRTTLIHKITQAVVSAVFNE
jgi:beta-lactamase class A